MLCLVDLIVPRSFSAAFSYDKSQMDTPCRYTSTALDCRPSQAHLLVSPFGTGRMSFRICLRTSAHSHTIHVVPLTVCTYSRPTTHVQHAYHTYSRPTKSSPLGVILGHWEDVLQNVGTPLPQLRTECIHDEMGVRFTDGPHLHRQPKPGIRMSRDILHRSEHAQCPF